MAPAPDLPSPHCRLLRVVLGGRQFRYRHCTSEAGQALRSRGPAKEAARSLPPRVWPRGDVLEFGQTTFYMGFTYFRNSDTPSEMPLHVFLFRYQYFGVGSNFLETSNLSGGPAPPSLLLSPPWKLFSHLSN